LDFDIGLENCRVVMTQIGDNISRRNRPKMKPMNPRKTNGVASKVQMKRVRGLADQIVIPDKMKPTATMPNIVAGDLVEAITHKLQPSQAKPITNPAATAL
jgi:hypothetical protein